MNAFTREELSSILDTEKGVDLLVELLAAQDLHIDSLKGLVDTKEKRIEELHMSIDQRDDHIGNLEYEVEGLEDAIETYKGFVKEDAAIIKGLQAA